MNELPKELTPQLLGLVLDEEVRHFEPFKNVYGEQCLSITIANIIQPINIDTLTRLMKEWCYNKGLVIGTWKHGFGQYVAVFVEYDEYPKQLADTEFEAVLKATHSVATEKGLLSEK